MENTVWIVLAFFAGAFVGVMTMALCTASKNTDNMEELWQISRGSDNSRKDK